MRGGGRRGDRRGEEGVRLCVGERGVERRGWRYCRNEGGKRDVNERVRWREGRRERKKRERGGDGVFVWKWKRTVWRGGGGGKVEMKEEKGCE